MIYRLLAAGILLVLALLLVMQGLQVGIRAPVYTGIGFVVIAAMYCYESLTNKKGGES